MYLQISQISIIYALMVMNFFSAVFYILYMNVTRIEKNVFYFVLNKTMHAISWGFRIASLSYDNPLFLLLADGFFFAGFISEAILFMNFTDTFKGKFKRYYLRAVYVVSFLIITVGLYDDQLKNLIMLIVFIYNMGLISRNLIKYGKTKFQRLLGILYGTFPIASSLVYPSVSDGDATLISMVYFALVITVQMIGIIGYLLIVNERDRKELTYLAEHDFLTNTLNRHAFYRKAESFYDECLNSQYNISIITIDIDWFKRINDTYGHMVGDDVLRHLSRTIKSVIRKDDLFARFGGEEFVIYLSHLNEAEVIAMIKRIYGTYDAYDFEAAELPPYSISIGVFHGEANHEQSIDTYIKLSDNALYHSKHNGKNRASYIKGEDVSRMSQIR